MLKRFSVQNYRRFKDKLTFDLSASNYNFNPHCVKQGKVKLALIYGENSSGKSNLGWALFDLVSHLTDNKTNLTRENYLNAFSDENCARFQFDFSFLDESNEETDVQYIYTKNEEKVILSETLRIDGNVVVDYRLGQSFFTSLLGTEQLNKRINNRQNLSVIKYIYNNTNLNKQSQDNYIFMQFMDFVNRILYFRSVFSGSNYTGYKEGLDNIEQDILNENHLADFEKFLADFGLNFELVKVRQLGGDIIGLNYHALKDVDSSHSLWLLRPVRPVSLHRQSALQTADLSLILRHGRGIGQGEHFTYRSSRPFPLICLRCRLFATTGNLLSVY